MSQRDYITLGGEWCFTLGLCFLLLWGGPWAPLAASGFPLAHVHSMGLHAGLAVGCFSVVLIRSLNALPRASLALICGVAGVSGFAVPAFFERLDSELFAAGVTAFGAMLTGYALALLLFCCVSDLPAAPQNRRPRIFAIASLMGLGLFGFLLHGVDAKVLLLVACFGLFPLSLVFACLAARRPPAEEGAAINRSLGAPTACVLLLGLESVVLMQLGYVVQVHQIGIALLAGVLLAVVWFVFHRSPTVVEAYFVAFPLMATGLLVFPFVDGLMQDAIIFVSNAIVLFVLALILTGAFGFLDSATSQSCCSMLLLGVFHVSVLVGFGLGAFFRNLFDGDSLWKLAVVFVCLYALSVCAFVLLWRRGQVGKGDVSPERAVVDSIAEQCALARACFALSERESEILELVMRGRDVPTIAKLLFISPNTVRFHMKNLYRAMDVHGKQEVIDVVESLK